MKRTVTLLAAIMLAIGTAQLVKAQPSSDPMMKEKEMMMDKGEMMMDKGEMMMDEGEAMMDEGEAMMDEGIEAAGNMMGEDMMEGAEDWSLEEEGEEAMDKAMGMPTEKAK